MKGKTGLNKTITIHLIISVSIIIFTMLFCACAATHDKKTTSINKTTDHVANKDESNTANAGDDLEIVCRIRAATGSHFKNKICATKAEWARRDKKKGEELDRFNREITTQSGINSGTGLGNMSGSMPH